MRTATRMAMLALGLLFGTAGCNWTRFDDQSADAPVRSISAPSGFDSHDFGKSITPLSTGRGSAAAFVATSLNGTHVVLVKIDSGGGVKTTAVSDAALVAADRSSITSVAEIPGPPPTSLLLGSPVVRDEDFGRVYTYTPSDPGNSSMDDTAKTLLIPSLGSNDAGEGRGLAAGFLDGAADTADYVVGSDNEIAVVVDGAVASTALGTTTVGTAPLGCDVWYDDSTQDSRFALRRPILAARLWADARGPAVQQLFVGAPRGTGMGTVSILDVVNGTLNCLASMAGPAPEFGHALAAGDVNGDGVNHFLVVGSPGRQAFVYQGWADVAAAVVPPALAITPSPQGVDFGFAVTALDVDGLPGDEVLVSDPRATVGGKTGAGHVLIYKFDAASNAMVQVGEIADHSPDTDENFGYTLNVLNFCRDDASVAAGAACPMAALSRILLVGAANEVFVYFRVGELGQTVADVRTP